MTTLDERLQAFRKLTPIERALALCIFGLNLTVAARSTLLNDHPDAFMLNQMKHFNETYQKLFGHAAHILDGESNDSDDMSFLKMFIVDPTSPGAVGKLARYWDNAFKKVRAGGNSR